VDHVVAEALGGPTELGNLRLVCGLCRERHKPHYADCLVMPSRDPEALRPKRSRIVDAA
jgi:hypothetical protein